MTKALRLAVLALAGLALALPTTAAAAGGSGEGSDDARVLVFTRAEADKETTRAGAAAIRAGRKAIEALGREHGFQVTVAGNGNQFNPKRLARYDAVVFLNNLGDVLPDKRQATFEQWFRDGGGFVGIHAAIEAEPDWEFYDGLLGTRATGASAVQEATLVVADQVHEASAGLPEYWPQTEAWYDFADNVRGESHVLATVDEGTYEGGSMGHDHPVAWCKDHQGGRSFYTAGGGTAASFGDESFLEHLAGAITWAAGMTGGDCGATVEANYEQVILNDEPGEPMSLAVLPDGRVLHTARSGQVRLYDPETELSPVITEIDVYQHSEDGLQFISLAPDFETSGWVYVYYSPPLDTPPGNAPQTAADESAFEPYKGYFQLSRVKFVDGPFPTLDMSTEQQIIRVGVDRGFCCHVAGEIRFDAAGMLYLSTGDDTNAGGSGGFAPINDQSSPVFRNPAYDARRSAGNTNDLRGAVLRIVPKAGDISPAEENVLGGAYTVPAGNLFAPGTPGTRPEIYLMGLRNPFRMDVSPDGVVSLADYSPDSRNPSPARGPEGTGRIIVAEQAANYGWPFCYSPDLPYLEYDFVTEESGEPFDCVNGPTNDSRHNTGLAQLPPVAQPEVWYTYEDRTPCPEAYLVDPPQECPFLFPGLETGGVGPHGATVYHYDAGLDSDVKFPEYYDGTVLFGEFTRDYLKEVRLDSSGNVQVINPFLDSFTWDNPMDQEWGPDGCLYNLDYGDGFFSANDDASLTRTCYVKGTRAPVAVMSASPTSGQAPLTVEFSSEGTFDPDPGDAIELAWDFDGNGTVDSTDPSPTHTYAANGVYTATLTVTDSNGLSDVENETVTVGNTAPTVEITAPPDGGIFAWGDRIAWSVEVTDPEDATIDCDDVEVTFIQGHDDHGHPADTVTGCSGVYQTNADDADHAGGYLYGAFVATYTDGGGPGGIPSLSGSDTVVVQQHRLEAEHFTDSSAVRVRNRNDGGQSVPVVDQIGHGDYMVYAPVNLTNIDTITFRHADSNDGAFVDVRVGAVDGPVVATATLDPTGSNNAFESVTVPIADPGGTFDLYLVFRAFPGNEGEGTLTNLNWFELGGAGVGTPP